MLKRLGGVLAGLVVGWLVVAVGDFMSGRWFKLPDETDVHDPASLKAALAGMPVSAWTFQLFGWLLAAFVGVLIANRISGKDRRNGWVTGLLLGGSTLANLLMLPPPGWVWVAVSMLFPLAVYAGSWCSPSRARA